MPLSFVPVPDLAALDDRFAQSQTVPVILFLHDPFCPTSRAAARELAQVPGAIALIDVARARALSHAIAQRTGIRHESPQVIVLQGGQTVWSAAHRAITAAAVMGAVGVLPPDPQPDPRPVPPAPHVDPRPEPVPMPPTPPSVPVSDRPASRYLSS